LKEQTVWGILYTLSNEIIYNKFYNIDIIKKIRIGLSFTKSFYSVEETVFEIKAHLESLVDI